MDNLFRQTRLRFSGVGQEKKEEPGSGEDLRIPPQKTVSFKEIKKDQNWFQRRLSSQMSRDYDSNNRDEQAIAVAAAAYAIISLKEQELAHEKKTKDDPKTSIKGKREDTTISIPEHGRVSKKVSEITEVSENAESKAPFTAVTDTKRPEKAPSLKRTSSSSFDKQLGGSFKPGSGASKPELPSSAVKPARTPSSFDKQQSSSFKLGSSTSKPNVNTTVKPAPQNGVGKSQADIWEATELARITEKYELQRTTILSWEDKKKAKAKRRLNRAEAELERKRAKATEKFRKRMQNIDQVVRGARAKAEENKRNDELKVKEKANTIRRTGKVPSACSCF